jgi:hypothetical protein
MDREQERIARKAHELWEAEGRPHGRDREHWDQAKEIVALEDSAGSALLPRETGASEPVEERTVAIDNEGQVPGLTDTGEHDLTAIEREPAITAPTAAKAAPKKAAAKRASAPADATKSAAPPSNKAPAKAKAETRPKGK